MAQRPDFGSFPSTRQRQDKPSGNLANRPIFGKVLAKYKYRLPLYRKNSLPSPPGWLERAMLISGVQAEKGHGVPCWSISPDKQPTGDVHHMTDSNVVDLKSPTSDAVGELLKPGAQQLFTKGIEAEPEGLLAGYADVKVAGKRSVLERIIQSGRGDPSVKASKVRDRSR